MARPIAEQTAFFLTPVDEMDEELSYAIQRSRRAKRVQLSVTPERGLVITIPERFAARDIPAIIEEHREWISDALRRFTVERAYYVTREAEPLLPSSVELRALGERREVIYQPDDGRRLSVRERGPYQLVVSGDYDDAGAQRALQRWLARRTKSEVVPWLYELASSRSITIRGTSVRNQRTRWGSCSADGRVSLNQNLLFLPRRLVRLVLIHELCHTRELNHSVRFWKLLGDEVPEYVVLGQELDRSWQLIPRWAQ